MADPDWVMVTVAARNWSTPLGEAGRRRIEVLGDDAWAEARSCLQAWAGTAGRLRLSAVGADPSSPQQILARAAMAVLLVEIDAVRLEAERVQLNLVAGPAGLRALWWMPSPGLQVLHPDLPEGARRFRPAP